MSEDKKPTIEKRSEKFAVEWERLAKAATEGPWQWTEFAGKGLYQLEGAIEYAEMNPVLVGHRCEACEKRGRLCMQANEDDRNFIAHARNAPVAEIVRGLLEELKDARKESKRQGRVIEAVGEWCKENPDGVNLFWEMFGAQIEEETDHADTDG